MPLPYYSRAATAEFWSEHWGAHSVEEALDVARRSPLTDVVERHVRAGGTVLEAGCGLGQYVILLREKGRAAVGVDRDFGAVRRGARAGAPLAVMDLGELGIRSGSLATYISLGVVEHDETGPGRIVAEAARVLEPGGVLLLSVPYWNGVRRLFGPYLGWRGRRARRAGLHFYQYAFTRREVRAFLEPRGFSVRSFHPYDPGRLLRKAAGALAGRRRGAVAAGVAAPGGSPAGKPAGRPPWQRALRRLLYSPPALRLLGHMILAVAARR